MCDKLMLGIFLGFYIIGYEPTVGRDIVFLHDVGFSEAEITTTVDIVEQIKYRLDGQDDFKIICSNKSDTQEGTFEILYRKGFQKSPMNSVIYFMTKNLQPQDRDLVPEILNYIQRQKTEVNFILFRDVMNERQEAEEFRLISFVSGGSIKFDWGVEDWFVYPLPSAQITQIETNDIAYEVKPTSAVIGSDKSDLKKFIQSVSLELRYGTQKTIVLSIYNTGTRTYSYDLDCFMTEMVMLIRVNSSDYDVLHRRPKISSSKNPTSNWILKDSIALNLHKKVGKPSNYNLLIFAETNFTFQFGFSDNHLMVKLHSQPVKGKHDCIYFSSNDPEARFVFYDMVLMNGSLGDGFIVLKHNGRFVAGFQPTIHEYFRIRVTIEVRNITIIRTSPNAIYVPNKVDKAKDNPAPAASPNYFHLISFCLIILPAILIACFCNYRTSRISNDPLPVFHYVAKENVESENYRKF